MGHSQGYWNVKQNQLNFLLDLAKKLNIHHPSDWGKVIPNLVLNC